MRLRSPIYVVPSLGLAFLLPGCAGGPPTPAGTTPPPRRVAVRLALPAGTVVNLATATATSDETDTTYVDALWREALRQSTHLDIAAGIERTDGTTRIAIHVDGATGQLTSTLTRPGEPPIPLASAAGSIPDALDQLAVASRQALGEEVLETPQQCAYIYSTDPECVALTEAALRAYCEGDPATAVGKLRRARQHDAGCTITLNALVKSLLALGTRRGSGRMYEEGEQIAVQALQVEHRLAPTTKHQLAHALLVIRSFRTGNAGQADRELLALAEASLRERPHDPHPLHSKAIALNFMRRYDESAPLLRELASRWPDSAEVGYHLAFAELAVGQPDAALAAIERVAPRLPRWSVVVPKAQALFHCGHHDRLRRFLEQLAEDPVYRKSSLLHEVRRMQAAQAILTDRAADAARFLLEDLEWIRQRPSQIEQRATDVAEAGEVLVRMGRHRELRVPLQAFEQLGTLPATFRDTMVFLGGMIAVSETGERAAIAERELAKDGETVWSSVLKAWAHHRRGELIEEMLERNKQYQTSEAPLCRAALAHVLDAAGSPDRAREARAELREQLLAFDLRLPGRHPLMNPAAALAYLAIR